MNPLQVERHIRIPSDGHQLAAVLTSAGERSPLIILAHGFGGDKDEKGLFLLARDYLRGSGFSVLRFDFRCCGENPGSFRDVRLRDLVSDLSNVAMFLHENRELRNRPLGFVGFSLGAAIGILSGVSVRSSVYWSPAIYTETDMAPRYETPEVLREREQLGYMKKGRLEVGDQFIQDLKTANIGMELRSVATPTLLIHGDADQRIPAASSVRAIDVLSQTNRRCQLRRIPGADHAFRSGKHTREWLFSATAQWFSRVLLPARRTAGLQQAFDEFSLRRAGGDTERRAVSSKP